MAKKQKNSVGSKDKKVTAKTVVGYSVLGVLISSLIFVGIVVLQNKELIALAVKNFDSLMMGVTKSPEEIEKMLEDNKDYQASILGTDKDTINKLDDPNLTDEERAALINEALFGNTSDKTQEDSLVTEEFVKDVENAVSPDEAEKAEDVEATQKPVQENPADSEDNRSDSQNEDQGKTPSDVTETPSVTVEKEDGKTNPPKDDKPSQNESLKENQTQAPEGTAQQPTPQQPAQPPVTEQKNDNGVMTEEEYNKRVSELVAKMYAIKADFVTKLDAFEARIKAEYKALPAEQKTSATKAKMVNDNWAYMESLEAQCDAQVAEVTSELTRIMTAHGNDTLLVDQINQAYINEKELKKAYYTSLYK